MSMKSKMKSFYYTYLFKGIFINFALAGCATNSDKPKVDAQSFSKLSVEDIQNASNPMQWQMVWVDDFGISELPHASLDSHLETFISGVKITTSEIDGKLVTMLARTSGCWAIMYEVRQVVITPARTEEKIQPDGSIEYDVTPATYKPRVDTISVGGACTYHPKIAGKEYDLNWFEPMNDFLKLNFHQSVNLREDNILEWGDSNGKTLARFKELPGPKK